jgi:probable poly-beta-1,6-N-acetyl-D-glucosamine export protein
MKYFNEINILRAIAILAVISIHISAYFTQMSTINFLTSVYMAVNVFSHFAVPLFVGISGFVLYNKYPGKTDLKKFYEKRLMSVLPPYIIFSTLYMGYTYIESIFLGKSVNFSIPAIIYRYITGGWNFALWFFVLIIQLYLLYPVIIRIYNYCDSRGRSFELLFVAFFMGVCYTVYSLPAVSLLGTTVPILGIATMFIGYLFYFILGMIVRSRYEELLLRPVSKTFFYCMWPLLLGFTLLGIFSSAQLEFNFDITRILFVAGQCWRWLMPSTTRLYYVIIFALCLIISLHLSSGKKTRIRILEKIGQDSFGIYLVHPFIMLVLVQVFSRFAFDWNNWLFYPVTFSLTLVLSILSVEVIRKFPYSDYVIGNAR